MPGFTISDVFLLPKNCHWYQRQFGHNNYRMIFSPFYSQQSSHSSFSECHSWTDWASKCPIRKPDYPHHTTKESLKYWSEPLLRYIAVILCYGVVQILLNSPLRVWKTSWDLCIPAWPQWNVPANSVYEPLQLHALSFSFLVPGWLISVQVL